MHYEFDSSVVLLIPKETLLGNRVCPLVEPIEELDVGGPRGMHDSIHVVVVNQAGASLAMNVSDVSWD